MEIYKRTGPVNRIKVRNIEYVSYLGCAAGTLQAKQIFLSFKVSFFQKCIGNSLNITNRFLYFLKEWQQKLAI